VPAYTEPVWRCQEERCHFFQVIEGEPVCGNLALPRGQSLTFRDSPIEAIPCPLFDGPNPNEGVTDTMTMEPKTMEQVRRSMRLAKLKVTKTGYEATLKADSPEEAVSLAVQVDSSYKSYQAQGMPMPGKAAPARGDLAPIMVKHGEKLAKLLAAGGQTGPRNQGMEAVERSFLVRIDLARNSKGVGWDIEVQPPSDGADSVAEALALQADVAQRLVQAFPEVLNG
jgi:hypothetical protein